MTKAEEIALLDWTIKRFGEDSYVGPWLKVHREDIVRCIENDFPVDVIMTSYALKVAWEAVEAVKREMWRDVRVD